MLHSLLYAFFAPLGLATVVDKGGEVPAAVAPVDPDTALATCVVLLSVMFVGRTVNYFNNVQQKPGTQLEPSFF